MSLKTFTALCLAGILSAGFAANVFAQAALPPVDPAIASMSNEELVAARQAAMKEDGGTLRNAGGVTGAAAVEAATTLLQNFTNFPALFREGSITDKSEALPAIWEHWDAFNAILTEGQGYAAAALTAANAGDTATFQANLGSLGKLCGTCHQQFRAAH